MPARAECGLGLVAAGIKGRVGDRVDTVTTDEPLALAVVTGTGHDYARDDGVAVILLGTLCP